MCVLTSGVVSCVMTVTKLALRPREHAETLDIVDDRVHEEGPLREIMLPRYNLGKRLPEVWQFLKMFPEIIVKKRSVIILLPMVVTQWIRRCISSGRCGRNTPDLNPFHILRNG